MRKIFIFIALTLSVTFSISDDSSTINKLDSQNSKTLEKQQECSMLIAKDTTLKELQKSGCCSHHGGVCGCEDGRAKCCDGTLSPTCGCD
jgi:hypothetical protein